MMLDEALAIVDPETCHGALAPYAGDRDTLHEKAVEACRMVADACRAAVRDLTYAAKASDAYESSCAICAGGLSGGGSCVWSDGVDMPTDCCKECGKCRCAWCVSASEWTWDATIRAGKEASGT